MRGTGARTASRARTRRLNSRLSSRLSSGGGTLRRLGRRGSLGYCRFGLLCVLFWFIWLIDGFIGRLGGRFFIRRGRGRSCCAAALLQRLDPLLSFIRSGGRQNSLLILFFTAEFDPELVFLIFRISFFNLDSFKGNDFGLPVLFLGVSQFLLLALESKITLNNFFFYRKVLYGSF